MSSTLFKILKFQSKYKVILYTAAKMLNLRIATKVLNRRIWRISILITNTEVNTKIADGNINEQFDWTLVELWMQFQIKHFTCNLEIENLNCNLKIEYFDRTLKTEQCDCQLNIEQQHFPPFENWAVMIAIWASWLHFESEHFDENLELEPFPCNSYENWAHWLQCEQLNTIAICKLSILIVVWNL